MRQKREQLPPTVPGAPSGEMSYQGVNLRMSLKFEVSVIINDDSGAKFAVFPFVATRKGSYQNKEMFYVLM